MTEERITEHTDQNGNTHTTHTVVSDGERKGSGGTTIVLSILAVVAIIAAIYIFGNMSNAEIAKDNAVGEAAGQVGDAVEGAGEAVEGAAERVAPE